jgi:diaminopimelate decarboxylase
MSSDGPASRFFARDPAHALCVEGVSLAALADDVGTPAWVYSGAAIDAAYARIDASLAGLPHLVAYAVKANANLAVLARLARLGAGCDIVSGGELARALRAGVPAARIVFSGVGKRADELDAALGVGIRSVHVESAEELALVEARAAALGLRAPIALRLNPDVDPETHPYIATGLHDTKFGLEFDAARALLPRILATPHLELEGVACHIGSQLPSAAPLAEAVERVARFARDCVDAGAPLRSLDAGGGWPIAYGDEEEAADPWEAFGDAIRAGLTRGGADTLGLEVLVEPGRALVGDAGLLLTHVLHVKQQPTRRFVIVDAAMSDLIRPALYDAHHAIVPVHDPRGRGTPERVDVVGPVCETGDFLAQGRALAPLREGDLVAIRGAGAYGMTMSSQYNARPRAPEVLVDGTTFRVVRARETIDDLMRGECV